jgi:superfamily II DNA or RNA helicase
MKGQRRMGLKSLDFPVAMNTSEFDVIKSFFTPALQTSLRYDRGVGFFSSGWLRMVIDGMAQFAENGGQARIITSPILNDEDWEALQKGAAAYHDRILYQSLAQTIDSLRSTLERDVRSALSWLIADGVLTFKLAVPQNDLAGEFHAKFGVFTDAHGDKVSFNGSNNETVNGTLRNYESFDIFHSWNEAYVPFVKGHESRFERLWTNNDPNLRVYNLPEAARQAIIQIRDNDDERPYTLPPSIKSYYESVSPAILWDHQREAISAWEENNRVGILSMATGSGKTRTALSAAEKCPELSMLVIAVPRGNLVEQWAEELKQHTSFPEPILIYESSAAWQDKLFDALLAGDHSDWQAPLIVIGTMKSLSSDRFLSVIEDAGIPERTLLIVDEVHNVGAPSYQSILRSEFQWRLGLSATPERHFDEVGSAAIIEYFSGTIFIYSMAQALKDGRLTPYQYYVYPAYLSDEEFTEYQNLTRRIISMRSRTNDDSTTLHTNQMVDGDNRDVERLLFLRATILKRCAEKVDILDNALKRHPPHRCLIYCAETTQLKAVSEILNHNSTVHLKYTSQTSSNQRAEALQALEERRIPILLAIDCLDEGVDVPNVDQAIILASSTNRRQFIQRRGRVLRRSPGKRMATLVDVIALPPDTVGFEGKGMIRGELARATEIAQLAFNQHEALLQIEKYVQPYGILLTDLLLGDNQHE